MDLARSKFLYLSKPVSFRKMAEHADDQKVGLSITLGPNPTTAVLLASHESQVFYFLIENRDTHLRSLF